MLDKKYFVVVLSWKNGANGRKEGNKMDDFES